MKQITFLLALAFLSLTYSAQAKLILCKWDQQNVTNPPRCYEINALPVGPNGTLTGACRRHMVFVQSDNWWCTCVDDCPQALMGGNSDPEVEIKDGVLFLDGIKAAQIANLPENVTTLDVTYASPMEFFNMAETEPADWELIGNQLYIEGIFVATLVTDPAEGNGGQLQVRSDEFTVKRIIFPEENYAVLDESIRFLLYPNPVKDAIFLSFFVQKEEKTSIDLYDGTGRLVKRLAENVTLSKGENQLTFDLRNIARGNYYITIQSNGKQISKKIILN
ncbi:MAG: T9SS type A sorting domain-containing protein [Saprospiraceae bacterium]|nr:T9SS type A sorting domain-containing protein [Saprospiraceae bacterium]